MNGLSEVLKHRRKELGLTLNQIAEMMGVTEATVQRWESGNIRSIRHEKVVRLAEILNVTPASIMGWEEEKPTAGQGDGPKERAHRLVDQIPEDKLQQALSYLQYLNSEDTK